MIVFCRAVLLSLSLLFPRLPAACLKAATEGAAARSKRGKSARDDQRKQQKRRFLSIRTLLSPPLSPSSIFFPFSTTILFSVVCLRRERATLSRCAFSTDLKSTTASKPKSTNSNSRWWPAPWWGPHRNDPSTSGNNHLLCWATRKYIFVSTICLIQGPLWLRPQQGRWTAQSWLVLPLRRYSARHQRLGRRMVASPTCVSHWRRGGYWYHSLQEKMGTEAESSWPYRQIPGQKSYSRSGKYALIL